MIYFMRTILVEMLLWLSSSPFFFQLSFFCHQICSMIHGMRIKNGKATYVRRYVRTSRIQQEEFFGGSKFMKVWY